MLHDWERRWFSPLNFDNITVGMTMLNARLTQKFSGFAGDLAVAGWGEGLVMINKACGFIEMAIIAA